jgi:C-terminal processing protease CtpA/Prc
MWSRGFRPIGFASFNGPAAGPAAALAAAKKVGAQYVVVARQFTNTVSGAIPLTTPTATTSYSQGTANIYGSGGSAYGTYNGTTTTYGSQTTYIPYSVAHYDQMAVFFAPMPRHGLGVMMANVPDTMAQQLGSAKGALVNAVRRDSPAFRADILPGDVIISVNGSEVTGLPDAMAIQQLAGQTITIGINRRGSTITKQLALPAGDW